MVETRDGIIGDSAAVTARNVFSTTQSSVLDFLRAQAVCLVVADHVLEATTSGGMRWFAQRLGWLGVMLFFVHTSLVLMFSMERTPERGVSMLRHFYIRRFFRIYPLSILVILVIVAFHIPVGSARFRLADMSLPTVLANVLLIQNLVYAPVVLGPLWSLPLEIQMYVVLPFLFWVVDQGRRLDRATAIWLACVGLALVQPHISDRANLAQFAPCFTSGVIAFCLSKRRQAAWPFWLWVVSLNIVLLAFYVLAFPFGNATPMALSWFVAFAVGWLIPNYADTTSTLLKRISATIARYSYGIYLTHSIALWVGFVVLREEPVAVRILASAGLIGVLPILAYHLVEAPGITFGAQLAARWRAGRIGAAVATAS
jgi:peptidoglycan/LPS O-acetylase OafA/YrhL